MPSLTSRPPWQDTVLWPPPWTPLLIAARWWVRYGTGTALKRALVREWLDVGLRQNPRPPRVVRTRHHGQFHIPTTIDFIPRTIYVQGCWEPCLSTLISARLRPGDGFIDIGAAGGWYSVLASRRVGPTGRVVAVEPTPAALEQLRINLALNHCGNVRVVPAAVAAEHGPIQLYLPDRGNTGAITTRPLENPASEITADGLPLADILDRGDLANARVIKIDVEGAESTVLAQLARLIPQLRADCEILTEITPQWLARDGHTAESVLKPMTDNGFHAYKVHNSYAPEDVTVAARHPMALSPTAIDSAITGQTDLLLTRTSL
ncbi:FkbM family methyltransferase [Nocardia uniformis]|uniref:FkbM family methyltransferase n=1 Tax=Nocardia uniformis TaxID=53432 RepID=A0A849CBQ5_9NOCA|nr:FkbM family methyltransferase [Nocardia uniformis]NNH73715.1 FkbM family methyltransferase [Nocardia uniformis]